MEIFFQDFQKRENSYSQLLLKHFVITQDWNIDVSLIFLENKAYIGVYILRDLP